MTTNHFTNGTYTAPADRPSGHLKHLRRAYAAAGLDVPAYLTEATDDILYSYVAEHERKAQAHLQDAALSDDPATLARQAVEEFSAAGAFRAAAERASQHQVAARLASLPEVRARAAADLAPAFEATVTRLGTLAREFDSTATTSLDPGHLGLQRQHSALAVIGEVQEALATLGAMTLVPRPGDPSRTYNQGAAYPEFIHPSGLVVDVQYDEEGTPDPAHRLWIGRGPGGMPEWDSDVHILACAGGWTGGDSTVTFRLYHDG